MPLKYLDLGFSVSIGAASPSELCEALGAFLLYQAGLPTGITTVTETYPDETFVFSYKGMVWRFTLLQIYDVRLAKRVPFRIDFDYIKQA